MANNTEQDELHKIINNLRGHVRDDDLTDDDGDRSWLWSVNKSFTGAEARIRDIIEAEKQAARLQPLDTRMMTSEELSCQIRMAEHELNRRHHIKEGTEEV